MYTHDFVTLEKGQELRSNLSSLKMSSEETVKKTVSQFVTQHSKYQTHGVRF